MQSELYKKYKKEVLPKLKEEFNISNDMQVPTIKKIVVNAGIGSEFKNNSGIVEEMKSILMEITGQTPIVINSKLAISNFKLREGTPNGMKVTLRGDRMWDFLSKVINVSLPRIKDFRGVSKKSFDPKGNYTLGIKEHTIFPEVDTSTLVKVRPLQIVINSTANSKDQGLRLLELLGMPFERRNK